MNILFYATWSWNQGITRATILPILKMLEKDVRVAKIVFCTIEASHATFEEEGLSKTIYHPIIASSKAVDLVRMPFLVHKLVKQYQISLLWCRGAPAGGCGSLVSLFSRVPFVVDSFEPHSEYMIDSQTWRPGQLKYIIQKALENLTIKRATLLLPVSDRFYRRLADDGVAEERLFVFPCVVDLEQFGPDRNAGIQKRNELSIDQAAIVGIYVGKYGGLYYDRKAFELYKALFDFFGLQFHLIILSEANEAQIRSRLNELRLPQNNIYISKVKHDEVPEFLRAADFAISTIKSVPAMQYCSPIKHGEYWAADLPILSTLTVGDDAEIIRNQGGGVLLTDGNPEWQDKLMMLRSLLTNGEKGTYTRLAAKYRNPKLICDVLNFVLSKVT